MNGLFAKGARAYISVDFHTKIFHQEEKIFEGTLEDALFFAKNNNYKLELVFDYDAGYLFVKTIPEAMEKKNRLNWELYQEQDLFGSTELLNKIQTPWCTVWLTLSNIKPLVERFRKQIQDIRWLGYEFYNAVKHLSLGTDSQIFLLPQEGRSIILGCANNVLLSCRVIDSKSVLQAEVEETAAYLAKFDVKSCDVYVFDQDTEQTIDFNLPNWFTFHQDIKLPVFESFGFYKEQLCRVSKQAIGVYAGCAIMTLASLFYIYNAWDARVLNEAHQQLTQKQNRLNESLSEYPNFSHLYKLDEYKAQNESQKILVNKLEKFIVQNGAIIKKLSWKDKKIEIDFAVRTPENYQEFLQIGDMLKKALYKSFVESKIEMEKDLSIQKSNIQIYKFKVEL